MKDRNVYNQEKKIEQKMNWILPEINKGELPLIVAAAPLLAGVLSRVKPCHYPCIPYITWSYHQTVQLPL